MSEEEIRKKRAFVWCWGKNKNGELSLGVTKDAVLPRFVKGLT
jgi:alpha-tubulin suppressor-like RCC1 family protein